MDIHSEVTTAQHTDAELIYSFESKQLECISLLYDKYAAAVYGVILRKIKDRGTAEKVLLQTFINTCDELSQEKFHSRILLHMINIANKIADDELNEQMILSTPRK